MFIQIMDESRNAPHNNTITIMLVLEHASRSANLSWVAIRENALNATVKP